MAKNTHDRTCLESFPSPTTSIKHEQEAVREKRSRKMDLGVETAPKQEKHTKPFFPPRCCSPPRVTQNKSHFMQNPPDECKTKRFNYCHCQDLIPITQTVWKKKIQKVPWTKQNIFILLSDIQNAINCWFAHIHTKKKWNSFQKLIPKRIHKITVLEKSLRNEKQQLKNHTRAHTDARTRNALKKNAAKMSHTLQNKSSSQKKSTMPKLCAKLQLIIIISKHTHTHTWKKINIVERANKMIVLKWFFFKSFHVKSKMIFLAFPYAASYFFVKFLHDWFFLWFFLTKSNTTQQNKPLGGGGGRKRRCKLWLNT